MVAIPLAMAVGSALLNRQATKSANKQTRIATAKQMAFQQRNSDTSYVRGMEDMKNAGLNPILAGKMGGATTPTGASYSAQKSTPVESASAGATSYMQNKQLAQNIGINKHNEAFANYTGIPIEQANPFMKQAYSAKYMYGTKIAPKTKTNINKQKLNKLSPYKPSRIPRPKKDRLTFMEAFRQIKKRGQK